MNSYLTRATLNDVLLGRKFPGKAFLLTFVSTCGIDIENDVRWEQAWDRLAAVRYIDKTGQAETERLRQQLAEAEARADQAARAGQAETERLRQQLAEAEARADQAARAGQAETERLRQQLAEAEARADQAAREADELRRRFNDVPKPEGTRPFNDVPKPEGTRPAAIPFWDVVSIR